MTVREKRKLENLCRKFSALTEENKNYVIGVSRVLLCMQRPGFPYYGEKPAYKRREEFQGHLPETNPGPEQGGKK
jgi:hypothetical protein